MSNSEPATMNSALQALPRAAFFDEVHSWRHLRTYVGLVGTVAVASMGALLLYHAITDTGAPLGLRLLVGGVFGAGFTCLFGWLSVVVLLRLIRTPARLRLDSDGATIGSRTLPWSQIRRVDFLVGTEGGWLKIVPATPDAGRIQLPVPLPGEKWTRLAEQLQDHFEKEGLNVEVTITPHRG